MLPFHYRCTQCSTAFERDEVRYLCPKCSVFGQVPLPGVLETCLDAPAIEARFDPKNPDWELLSCVEAEFYPELKVGNTPLCRTLRLGNALGLERLWVKNEALNPSGSLKDRASFLMVAEARRLKESCVVCASTGNAASSLACVCASAGLEAVIYVPEKAPIAKLIQMELYGARVILVKGTYDEAFRLSLEHTAQHGGLNRNTAYHPLTLEGKKTAGLEIWAQLGFRVPEWIVVPTGDGVILGGIHKAFVDLKRAGLIERLPRLLAVQAETSDAIHRYFKTGVFEKAPCPQTVADSISVSTPSNAHGAQRVLVESQGDSICVSDEAILNAQVKLARMTGLFAEPSSAAALAGLEAWLKQGNAQPAGDVVLIMTAHGLKDLDGARQALEPLRTQRGTEPS